MIQELDEAEQSFGSSSGTTAGSTVAGTNKEVNEQAKGPLNVKPIEWVLRP